MVAFSKLAFRVFLFSSFVTGCFQQHDELPDARAAAEPDAGPSPRDAGPPPRDAGPPPPTPDAGLPDDAGPARPAEPEPDLGPAAKPSDYPAARDWLRVSSVGADAPCCVMGEPQRVTADGDGRFFVHFAPRMAWGAGVFRAVANQLYVGPGTATVPRMWRIGPDGARLDEGVLLEPPPLTPEAHVTVDSLRFAEGRWALGVSVSADDNASYVRLFDREGVGASPWHRIGEDAYVDVTVARLTHGDRWLAFGATLDVLFTQPFSDDATEPSIRYPRTDIFYTDPIGLRSRVAVLRRQVDDRSAPSELVVIGGPPDFPLLGRVPTSVPVANTAAMAALRDRVVVATLHGTDVEVEVLDPFDLRTAAGPRVVGSYHVDSFGYPFEPGVAGADTRGLAGLCWGADPTRTGPALSFGVVDEEGRPRGQGVTVLESSTQPPWGCTVATDGHGFLVAWWSDASLWVRRIDPAP